MKISVVFSFFNEEDVLEELVSRVRNIFLNELAGRIHDHELIFVNDRSTDRSLELLQKLALGNTDIKIINMSRNFGISPCVFAGFEFSSGDAVIYMDADLQDPPEIIPQMVDLWLNNPGIDVIHTKRSSRAGESKIKLFITKIGYAVLHKVSHITIKPEVGDFKLLSRRSVNQLVKFKEHRPFTRGLVNWIGFNQITITYHREERFAGETKFPVFSWGVISNFLDSALISFSDVPLKIALLLGFMVSFGAFGYLVIIFIMKYLNWSLPGWSAIMATMLMLGGIQLFTLGMLGLYINAIFIEAKKRPNYIIESTYGFDPPPVQGRKTVPRVLITGGAGYLGSILTEHLLDRSYKVTVLDSLIYGEQNLFHLCANPAFEFVHGDARDESLVRKLTARCDVIIPLAAIVGATACDHDPLMASSINLDAIRMINRLRSPSQLIVYPTTNSGYGTRTGDLFCTEETPLEPISLYGRTKTDAEAEVLASDNSITLRLATVFGMSPRMRMDLLVNHFVFAAVTDGYLVIFEKDFKRNYIHIRDVADCFIHCIEHPAAMIGRPHNVGLDDANLSKEELALKIREHLPRFFVHFAEVGSDPDKRNYIVSNQRLREAGFSARRSLDDGIRELIKGYALFGRTPRKNV